MESLANLISAISALAWPTLAGVLAFKFVAPLTKLIDSARGRKFSIKVGGNELSMEEASEQQRLMTSDIQKRLAELESKILDSNLVSITSETTESAEPRSKRILWVDDRPRNNSYLVANLEEQGHVIDIALDTGEGMEKFQAQEYDIVISDMGRPRDDKAGITLTKQIRKINQSIPIFIFCGGWASTNLKEEALGSGVTAISSSGTEILRKVTQ